MATPSSIQELLQAGYSFVRGVETNRAISALTLDHLIQQQIDAIQGGDSRTLLNASGNSIDVRMSKLSMLDAIEKGIDNVVQAVGDAGDDPTKLEALGLNPEKVG
jgi:hypothetical protein